MDSIPVDKMNSVPLEITLAEDLSRLSKWNTDASVPYLTWLKEVDRLKESLKSFGLGLECDDENSFYYVYALKDREE